MTKFILIILFIIFIVPYLLGVIGRFLLGGRPRQNTSSQQRRSNSSSFNTQNNPKRKKKVIEKDEGEYVDYVEIKEKKK
jgi:hypothetical protein